MHAPHYRETFFSELYPGNTHSCPAYIPTLQSLDRFLPLTPEQKARTLLRSDSGFGADYNLDYALEDGWQVLTKGYGGKRPARLRRAIPEEDWLEISGQRWVARACQPPSYFHPVQYLLLRWKNESGQMKYSSVICSVLAWSLPEVIAYYDDRGSCETQIQADKGGLKVCQRRKSRLAAQEALILLTDLAHNLLAWAGDWMFPEGRFASFGTTRWVEDVLALPGRLVFDEQGRLCEAQINGLHPHAEAVAEGLRRLLDHFDNP